MNNQTKFPNTKDINPLIPICFFCREEKNKITTVSKLEGMYKDTDTSTYAILDYEPCDRCKAIMKSNVTIVGVSETPTQNGQPPIATQSGKEYYPSGEWLLMKSEAIASTFPSMPEKEVEETISKGKLLLKSEVVIMMAKQVEAQN